MIYTNTLLKVFAVQKNQVKSGGDLFSLFTVELDQIG